MTFRTLARNLKEYNKLRSYRNPRFRTEFTGRYEHGTRLYQDYFLTYGGDTITVGDPYHIIYNQSDNDDERFYI